MLAQACRQTQRWQQLQPGLSCAVNLASRQLSEARFAQRVARILKQTGLPPALLTLEITESQLMQDSAQTLACLRELASLGVRLALDDFGTGYSSLGYLTRFPLHILKVDKSFIIGVEQPSHLEFLREQGCRYAQGYLLSKPQPVKALEQLFQQHPLYLHRSQTLPAHEYCL